MTQVVVGKFGKTFALKGFVYVFSYTDPLQAILDYQPWLCSGKEIWIESFAFQHKKLTVKFKNIDVVEQAKFLCGQLIQCDDSLFPELDGQYYYKDLVGMKVYDQQNKYLGSVESIIENPVHDMLMIVSSEKRQLVPFVDEYVLKVDLENTAIILNWK